MVEPHSHVKSYLRETEKKIQLILAVFEKTGSSPRPRAPSTAWPDHVKVPEYFQHLHGLAYGDWTKDWELIQKSRDSLTQMDLILEFVRKLNLEDKTVFWHKINGGKWREYHKTALKHVRFRYDVVVYNMGAVLEGKPPGRLVTLRGNSTRYFAA